MIEDIQAGLSQALTDIPWGQWLSALFLLLLGLLLLLRERKAFK